MAARLEPRVVHLEARGQQVHDHHVVQRLQGLEPQGHHHDLALGHRPQVHQGALLVAVLTLQLQAVGDRHGLGRQGRALRHQVVVGRLGAQVADEQRLTAERLVLHQARLARQGFRLTARQAPLGLQRVEGALDRHGLREGHEGPGVVLRRAEAAVGPQVLAEPLDQRRDVRRLGVRLGEGQQVQALVLHVGHPVVVEAPHQAVGHLVHGQHLEGARLVARERVGQGQEEVPALFRLFLLHGVGLVPQGVHAFQVRRARQGAQVQQVGRVGALHVLGAAVEPTSLAQHPDGADALADAFQRLGLHLVALPRGLQQEVRDVVREVGVVHGVVGPVGETAVLALLPLQVVHRRLHIVFHRPGPTREAAGQEAHVLEVQERKGLGRDLLGAAIGVGDEVVEAAQVRQQRAGGHRQAHLLARGDEAARHRQVRLGPRRDLAVVDLRGQGVRGPHRHLGLVVVGLALGRRHGHLQARRPGVGQRQAVVVELALALGLQHGRGRAPGVHLDRALQGPLHRQGLGPVGLVREEKRQVEAVARRQEPGERGFQHHGVGHLDAPGPAAESAALHGQGHDPRLSVESLGAEPVDHAPRRVGLEEP